MRFLSVIAAVIFFSSYVARGEDWPKWRGPDGTGISREKIADRWPAEGPKHIWSQPVGLGFSSPVAVDGKIYLFSQIDKDDVLNAFDAATGNVIWTQKYTQTKKGEYEFPGTRATPTIEGNLIYTYGPSGDLVCRKLEDGTQIWKINVLDSAATKPMPYGQASCPLIVGDLLYVM